MASEPDRAGVGARDGPPGWASRFLSRRTGFRVKGMVRRGASFEMTGRRVGPEVFRASAPMCRERDTPGFPDHLWRDQVNPPLGRSLPETR
jgi:hypothetical protein